MRPPRRDSGSVLMLVPAGVLVLVVLGAIAVDSAVAFLGQREASNAAAAAANDAAGAAVSDAAFYRGGSVVLDPARAREAAQAAVAARAVRGLVVDAVDVRVDGPGVCVTVRGRVPYVFARSVPFTPGAAVVRGEAGAVAAVPGDDADAVETPICK